MSHHRDGYQYDGNNERDDTTSYWYTGNGEELSQVAIDNTSTPMLDSKKDGLVNRIKSRMYQWWLSFWGVIMFIFRIPLLIWLRVQKVWIEERLSQALWKSKYYIAVGLTTVLMLYTLWSTWSMITHWDPYGLTDSNEDLLAMILKENGGHYHSNEEAHLKIVELGEVRCFDTKHYNSVQLMTKDRAVTNKCQPIEISEILSRTIVLDFDSFKLNTQYSNNHHKSHSNDGHDHHHSEEDIHQDNDDDHNSTEGSDHSVVSLDEVIHINEESLKRWCNKWGEDEWFDDGKCSMAITPSNWNLTSPSWYHDSNEHAELIQQQHKRIKSKLSGFSPCLITVITRLGEIFTMANPVIINDLLDHNHPDFTPFSTPFQLEESNLWKMNGFIQLPMYANLHVSYLDVTQGEWKKDKNHIFVGNDGFVVYVMINLMYGGQQWIGEIASADRRVNPPPMPYKTAEEFYARVDVDEERKEKLGFKEGETAEEFYFRADGSIEKRLRQLVGKEEPIY